MIVGLIWIVAGLAIALANSVVGDFSQQPPAVSWQLNLIGVMGLVLASQGCRIFQDGWHVWRWR